MLGEINDGEMNLSPVGEMVLCVWNELPQRFKGWDTDAFIIMPNHIHGIIVKPDVGADLVPALSEANQGQPQGIGPTKAKALGDVIGGFKSLMTNEYIKGVKQSGWPSFDKYLWQPDYYERVIRDERELEAYREYIAHNPLGWNMDSENPEKTR